MNDNTCRPFPASTISAGESSSTHINTVTHHIHALQRIAATQHGSSDCARDYIYQCGLCPVCMWLRLVQAEEEGDTSMAEITEMELLEMAGAGLEMAQA